MSLVSVVIPTFNRAHLIRRTVENVLGQTHADVHAIVVDDGSTDDTPGVMASFAGNDRVTYVQRPNGGVSAARNHGLTLLRGDYVAYLDSDDQWVPWKLEAQLACLRALPAVGMIWTDVDIVDQHGALVKAACMRTAYSAYELVPMHLILPEVASFSTLAADVPGPPPRTQVRWGDAFSALALGNLCQPSTLLLTRARVEQVGPWNETMRTGEDHEYHLRVAREGTVALLDCSTVRYRKGADDQLTHPDLKLVIAENYLRTIVPVFEHERARIALPPQLLDRTLAAAHAWLGDELMRHGRTREARHHFTKSLRSAPLQARTALMLAMALAPPSMTTSARALYRRAKQLVRP